MIFLSVCVSDSCIINCRKILSVAYTYIYIYTWVRIIYNSLHEEHGYKENIHIWKVALASVLSSIVKSILSKDCVISIIAITVLLFEPFCMWWQLSYDMDTDYCPMTCIHMSAYMQDIIVWLVVLLHLASHV